VLPFSCASILLCFHSLVLPFPCAFIPLRSQLDKFEGAFSPVVRSLGTLALINPCHCMSTD
jgi:hypothetical protein